MIVCVCRNVSDRRIRSSLLDGAQNVRDLRAELGVTGCCGKCGPRVRELVAEHGAARTAVQALTAECACAAAV